VLVMLVLIGSSAWSSRTVARPVRHIGEVLMQLAGGNKKVAIPYARRADEVGDAARAAQTFKDNLVRMEQMELEQKQVEAGAIEARTLEIRKLAGDFQVAVGAAVETVSSAASNLEATASALAHNAEDTQQLTGAVAGASAEVSVNVQSVATASDELAAS